MHHFIKSLVLVEKTINFMSIYQKNSHLTSEGDTRSFTTDTCIIEINLYISMSFLHWYRVVGVDNYPSGKTRVG